MRGLFHIAVVSLKGVLGGTLHDGAVLTSFEKPLG